VTASVLVNIGMWLMRYVIVVPTLSVPYLPVQPGVMLAYVPTWVEWSITAGGFAAFGLMYLLFSKIFPIISIWELQPEHKAASSPGQAKGPDTAREALA
jgi:molybdopterin-containing oxidoreductase family membrane subunit